MSSIRSLLSKFEPDAGAPAAPAVAAKDRFKSTLDAPRATLSTEAEAARARARAVLAPASSSTSSKPYGASTESRITGHAIRKTRALPTITASDNEELANLKRAIIARDQEIRDANGRLHDLAQRLEKLVDLFSSSVVADDFTNSVQLASSDLALSSVRPTISSASGAAPTVGSSPSSILDNGVENGNQSAAASSPANPRPQRMSASTNAPTSLEAILAAARGTAPRTGPSERPKYAKMLRDLR